LNSIFVSSDVTDVEMADDALSTMERDLWLGLDTAIAYISDMATEMAEQHRHCPDGTSSCPARVADAVEVQLVGGRDLDVEESSRLSWVDAIRDTDNMYDVFGLNDAVNTFNFQNKSTSSSRHDVTTSHIGHVINYGNSVV